MFPSRPEKNALQRMAGFLLAHASPRRMALGFTVGMILGLVPKDNLIALALTGLVLTLRVNKGAALAAAVLFSCLGPFADPFTHTQGQLVLNYEPLQPAFAALFNVPFAAWLGFNNTVVMGSLLVGLYAAYPVYWLTHLLLAWCLPCEPAILAGSTRGAA
jgi:uncharacterized protein (TIGR03546 family)